MSLPQQIKQILLLADDLALKTAGRQWKQNSIILENWMANPVMVENEPIKDEPEEVRDNIKEEEEGGDK